MRRAASRSGLVSPSGGSCLKKRVIAQLQYVLENLLFTSEDVEWLVLVHVNGGSSDSVILESEGERSLVDKTSARGVHKERARPHLLDGVLVNEMVVVLVESAVKGDTVGLEQQVLQGVHSVQAEGLLNAVRKVGVVEYHIKPKSLGS